MPVRERQVDRRRGEVWLRVMQLFEYEQLSTQPRYALVYPVLPNSSWFVARLLRDLHCPWIHVSARLRSLGSVWPRFCGLGARRPSYLALPSFGLTQDLLALPISPRLVGLWKDQWQSPAEANAPHAFPRERDASLRGRILRLEWMETCPHGRLLEPAQRSLAPGMDHLSSIVESNEYRIEVGRETIRGSL
jgi:hypothetical protein